MVRFFGRNQSTQDALAGVVPSKEDGTQAAAPSTTEAANIASVSKKAGLQILYEKKGANLDVIFIHGVTGDSLSTWQHKDSKTYWPVDLMAKDFPYARTLAFGYDAGTIKWTSRDEPKSLREVAKELVMALAVLRSQDDSFDRKVVLVAHGLGGLVAKQAIVLSEQLVCDDRESILWSQLHHHAIGIVFLGTPHDGTRLEPYIKSFGNMMRLIGAKVNNDTIGTIDNSWTLPSNVQKDFGLWVHNNQERFRLACFFEELERPLVGRVVEPRAATLDHYPSFGIHANHTDMTRFRSSDDPGYQLVRAEIRTWCEESGLQKAKAKAGAGAGAGARKADSVLGVHI